MTKSFGKFNKFSLKNKNALITGAGGLLGREHAEALLESEANIILTDVNINTLEKNYYFLKEKYKNSNLIYHSMDVTNLDSIEELNSKLLLDGVIEILVNNAAIDSKYTKDQKTNEASRLEQFSIEQWNKELSVGLTGAFNCIKVFGSVMAEKGNGGVILNIASDLSVIAPNQSLYKNVNFEEKFQPVKPVTYSVIKTGLVGLTRYVATYWADKNIRCNSISPGGVLNNHEDEFIQRISKLIPLGRMARKDEYRSAIQFLCSDASSYMTGHNLVIDGGRSIW